MVILTEQKQHFYFCGQIFIQLLKQYKHVAPRTEMKSACYALLSDSAELRSKFPNIRKVLNIDEKFMNALKGDNHKYALKVINESLVNPAYFGSTIEQYLRFPAVGLMKLAYLYGCPINKLMPNSLDELFPYRPLVLYRGLEDI